MTATVETHPAADPAFEERTAKPVGLQPAAALPGEFEALELKGLSIWPPVVLAPMAGVTDVPFRSLCRGFGAGLYVNQMITARAWLEGDRKTLKLAEFGEDEYPRSIQLYGTVPSEVGETVRRLVAEDGVDHIDMNFGCPVPKVTRHGGGAALPVRHGLLRAIVQRAVAAAGDVPVTIKFRMGVNDDVLTFIQTGRIAEDEGVSAIALHARTAEQLYSGSARWDAIGRLKQAVTSIPVLGNGDIWEPADALAMMRATDCDGVVIGRGCLGRPWLFGALAASFDAEPLPELPNFAEVSSMMLEHARMLVDWYGSEDSLRQFRKHALWYLMGFPVGGEARNRFARVSTLAELEDLCAAVEVDLPFPADVLRQPRSHTGGPRPVHLPEGWLDRESRASAEPPARGADSIVSGG
ncbi:MAG: tRNA dihydrouridine synthase DusB [Actinomycetota bacterium]